MEEGAQLFMKQREEEIKSLTKSIAEDLVGFDALIDGPFKSHRQTYADYAASGKAVKFIEDYISNEVLPIYSNTHTSSSFTGIQTSCFREEAREIIRDTYRCTDNDVILFAGNGCTGAISTFVRILGIERKRVPFGTSTPLLKCTFPGCPLCFNDPGDLRLHQRTHTDGDASSWTTDVSQSTGHTVRPISGDASRPIVFVGPFEHHSNLLPWREADVDFVQIGVNSEGGLDLEELRSRLRQFASRPLRVVSLNYVSNVTGIMTPMAPVNQLVHEEGALICWDCATACSHEAPMMNNTSVNPLDYCDAMFFSPHKMVGGAGCPGLLILKKKLLINETPSVPGGGTIFFVSANTHRYTQVLTEREEGGTPNILGAIRLGLVLHMHNKLGWSWIKQREQQYYEETMQVFRSHPNIVVLGDDNNCPKSPVISILIKHHGRFLHWNFVSMLLSDLFGIQTRSGCVCAGPYSMRLLGIDSSKSRDLDQILLDKNEIFRPGYTRLSLSYVMTPAEVSFIQQAVVFVSEHGWKFLPEYIFYEDTAEWRHRTIKNKKPFRRWLNDITVRNGALTYEPKAHAVEGLTTDGEQMKGLFEGYLKEAMEEAEKAVKAIQSPHYVVSEYKSGNITHAQSALVEAYRWYVTPIEAYQDVRSGYVAQDAEILPHLLIDLSLGKASDEFSAEAEKSQGVNQGSSTDNSATAAANATSTASTQSSRDAHSTETLKRPLATTASSSNPFAVKLTSKKTRASNAASCGVSASGREIVPLSVVSMVQEEGVEFHYRTGVDGALEFTAEVPGMDFAQRVRYMKQHKDLFPPVPNRLMKLLGQAIGHFDMLHEGDRVMLGLSGGKDSLTMLHCLLQLQRRSPTKFELACVTVDPQTTGFDPSPLRDYCKQLGVKYFYESRAVIALAKQKLKNGSICSWCSRMKRGILYSTMRREKYNVLVLAQHLDDLAESFLMSVFHNGVLRTMKACYMNKEQDVRIIRPFVYVREKQLREFAKTMNLPIIDENCPACFEGPKERYRMKTLLAAEENLFPNVFNCILSAIIPLMRHKSAVGCAMERMTPREMRGQLRNLLKERAQAGKAMEVEDGNQGEQGNQVDLEDQVDEDDEDYEILE